MLYLSDAEIDEYCWPLTQAAAKLRYLHRRGFHRAEIRAGRIRLERAHYDAVCTGAIEPARPKVKPPTVRPTCRAPRAPSAARGSPAAATT